MGSEMCIRDRVRHGFTHFELYLDLFAASVPLIDAEGFQQLVADLDDAALPTVMRKCVTIAQGTVVEK